MHALLELFTISTCIMAQARLHSSEVLPKIKKIHTKCRGLMYAKTMEPRFQVPVNKVPWNVDFDEYEPHNFTSPTIIGKPWADPEIGTPGFNPAWNNMDKFVDRQTYEEDKYNVENGYPLNVIGRTGIRGRGVLGRWGPNHAADPIVSRWKRDYNGEIVYDDESHPILQIVIIKRQDTGEWALPGGMVDPGETVTSAAIREFYEEAMNSSKMTKAQKRQWQESFDKFFHNGEVVYKGYMDDPRNTDNAWMETAAYNFHDDNGTVVGRLQLHAGDDAVGVRWVDVEPELIKHMYASHSDIVNNVLIMRLAYVGIAKQV